MTTIGTMDRVTSSTYVLFKISLPLGLVQVRAKLKALESPERKKIMKKLLNNKLNYFFLTGAFYSDIKTVIFQVYIIKDQIQSI